jgi:antitoxin ParD1/3/4
MATDRTEKVISERLKEKVEEVFADPGASVPAREVFRRLRAYHAAQAAAEDE